MATTYAYFVLGAASVLGVLAWLGRARRWRAASMLVVALLGLGALGWFYESSRRVESEAKLVQSLPHVVTGESFVGSIKCRQCHPQEYASWHSSYHRQMTQPAAPAAVKASFDGERFDVGGNRITLRREGDEFWIDLDDRSARREMSRPVSRQIRVVMTTGSHHMQGFWVARGTGNLGTGNLETGNLETGNLETGNLETGNLETGNLETGNLLDQLPLMWLVGDERDRGRWVPLSDSFLAPPEGRVDVPWNASCIFCHSVQGKPRLNRTTLQANTEVVELGIACESCHGAGRQHIEAHRDEKALSRFTSARPTNFPYRKADQAADGSDSHLAERDDTIVHPGKLEAPRSAEVCGQCHAVATFPNERLENEWYLSGSSYRPGENLQSCRLTLTPSRLQSDQLAALKWNQAEFWESNFWPDGMVRVAGREYNGLLESACYQKGGMTCLSCHSLHHSDPDDQLAVGMRTNDACYPCHASYRDGLVNHTHHLAESSGSLCYNCHMPHTTYGLFKAIRSHQISSPNVAATVRTGRPDACNLCHLDQTLAWTNAQLSQWYGQERTLLDEQQETISAGALWLLSGDAVQRALLAWSCGWQAARDASGEDWLPPMLATLLEDPYSAVRLVATRSLDRLGYTVDNDFLAPAPERAAARAEVLSRWQRSSATSQRRRGRRILLDEDGKLLKDELQRLLGQRDDHPLRIQE